MRRSVVFAALAACAIVLAALIGFSALKNRNIETHNTTAQSVNIFVAARDLPLGSKLKPDTIKAVRWFKDSVPPGAFTNSTALLNQFTKTNLVQNEPLTSDCLFGTDKNAGVFSMLIPDGMRAMSVPVDEVSDVAGFVQPHSRVDILVSVAAGESGNQPFSKIVLQNIEVLAGAQDFEKAGITKPEVARVVTLLVTPQQAERLTLASHEGALRLAMRNYADKQIIKTTGVDMAEMLRAYSDPPQLPLSAHRLSQTGTRSLRPESAQVEIMRDGKSIEDVAFTRSREEFRTISSRNPAASGAASGIPGRPAPNGEAAGATVAADAAITQAQAALALTTRARNFPPLADMSTSGNLATDHDAGFATPHAKTIDIP